MITFLDTENERLQNLFSTPIIGGIAIFLIALLPVPIMFLVNGIFEIVGNELIERSNAIITGLWNMVLTFRYKIKISVFFIPCWILFIIIGVHRLFMIIP